MPAAAETLARQYGAELRSIDAIEAAGDIDAVVICTPTDTHADLIERFARAGKAIFAKSRWICPRRGCAPACRSSRIAARG